MKTVQTVSEYKHTNVLVGAQIYISVEVARQLFKLADHDRFGRNVIAQSVKSQEEAPEAYEEVEALREYVRTLAESVLLIQGDCVKTSELANSLKQEYVNPHQSTINKM